MKAPQIISFLWMIVWLASCANQIPPTGGAKDVTPPQVIQENPKNLSTNFKGNTIHIYFDEFVQLNNPTDQIYFSPALKTTPKFRTKGKSIIISLPDSLQANTTYTINFGNAIKDITEGNILLDYNYVFSTGNYIDSFKLDGNVTDAYTDKPSPKILVSLYKSADDSVVVKERPFYNTRTDSFGNFSLTHLAAGRYKLFAIDDADQDEKYSQISERIAFADSPVVAEDTSKFYQLYLFKAQPSTQKLLNSWCSIPGKIYLAFARPLQKPEFEMNPPADYALQLNKTHDTVSLFVDDIKSDSMVVKVSDNEFSDTAIVRMKVVSNKTHFHLANFSFQNVVSGSKTNIVQLSTLPLILRTATPVTLIDSNRKIILQDSSGKSYSVSAKMITDTSTKEKNIAIPFNWKQGMNYSMVIPDSAFEDIYHQYSDTLKLHLHIPAEEELGTLKFNLQLNDSSYAYFYELKNGKGRTIAKNFLHPGMNELDFENILPDAFKLTAVQDRNHNLKWDPGNYWEHRQPEKIFYYNEDITLRPYWELDMDVTLDNKGFHSAKKK